MNHLIIEMLIMVKRTWCSIMCSLVALRLEKKLPLHRAILRIF